MPWTSTVPWCVMIGVALACGGGGDEAGGTGTSGETSASATSSVETTVTGTGPTTTVGPTTSAPTTTVDPDTSGVDDASSDAGQPNDDCEFSESFDLPDGSPWPSHWTVTGGVAVADVQGGRGRLVPTTGPYAVARIATPVDCTDIEVTFAFELSSPGNQGFGLYVRQNGGYLQQTNPTGEGYSTFIQGFMAPAGIGVWREVAGDEEIIGGNVAGPLDAGTTYRARLRVTTMDAATTLLQARYWPDGAPEPGMWQVERTDASPSLQGRGGNIAVDTYTTMSTGVAGDMFVDDIVTTAAL